MTSIFANKYRDHEPIWHVQLTMIAAIVLQLLLPNAYVFGSRYALVVIELAVFCGARYNPEPGGQAPAHAREPVSAG